MSYLEKIINDYNEQQEKFRKKVTDDLGLFFTEFFVRNPEFRTVEWKQYTPYFNDGEECELRVSDKCFTLQPEFYPEYDRTTIEEYEYDTCDIEPSSSPIAVPSDYQRKSKYHKDQVEAFDSKTDKERANLIRLWNEWEQLNKTLNMIPEDLYLSIFDNHKSIRIDKNGIDITEYEHE